MNDTVIVGVSACLLGEKVRYDGGHKYDPYITGDLGKLFTLVPVCPEAECGMGIPREPMRLEGDPESPRLVTIEGQRDMTEQVLSYCRTKMAELEGMELCGFIFKARSPSCGLGVDVYHDGVPAGKGKGLFAVAVVLRFPLLPAVDEDTFGDAGARERFIEEVYGYHRELKKRR